MAALIRRSLSFVIVGLLAATLARQRDHKRITECWPPSFAAHSEYLSTLYFRIGAKPHLRYGGDDILVYLYFKLSYLHLLGIVSQHICKIKREDGSPDATPNSARNGSECYNLNGKQLGKNGTSGIGHLSKEYNFNVDL